MHKMPLFSATPLRFIRFVTGVIVLISCVVASHGLPTSTATDNDVIMARCRATCARQHLLSDAVVEHIEEVTGDDRTKLESLDEKCHRRANCQMCWKTCAMIYGNVNIWGSMCRMPKSFCVSMKKGSYILLFFSYGGFAVCSCCYCCFWEIVVVVGK